MDIGSVRSQVAGQVTPQNFKPAYKPREVAVQDGFQKGEKSEALDADKMKSLQTGEAKKSWGMREAKGLVGIGVMMGGMLAAAALGGPFAPALMIGAMFGGLAIMAV